MKYDEDGYAGVDDMYKGRAGHTEQPGGVTEVDLARAYPHGVPAEVAEAHGFEVAEEDGVEVEDENDSDIEGTGEDEDPGAGADEQDPEKGLEPPVIVSPNA